MTTISERYYSGERHSLPFLTTKLYRPPITPEMQIRAELLDHLEQNRHRPLTLISAPAGYGKSTLASMWLEDCDCASAWISLDEGDNDLRTFLTYVLAATRGAFPDAELALRDELDVPALAPPTVLARRLLNDLDRISKPFVLVLDDAHRLHEQAIYVLLGVLVQHPLPIFHLVLVTRRDPPLPIASLRAKGQVTEIRARDLRFSAAETASLLSRRLHREIDEATANEWTNRTEGWITAIHLATLSLHYRDRDADLGLSIERGAPYLQEYLLAEVLKHLSPIRQEWLLASSLLDRFCAPLCEAVCRSDSADEPTGEDFVRWLLDSSLFVIPLDDRREWFRFHDLFQAHLRDILEKNRDSETIAASHRRASRWLADNGLMEESIKHALAGGDTDSARRLVLQHRHEFMNENEWQQLDRWLGLFPEATVADDPLLALTKARLPSAFGQEQYALVARAGSLAASLPPDAPETKEVIGEVAAFAAFHAVFAGPGEAAIHEAERAMSLLPLDARYIRCELFGILAFGYQMSGEYTQGIRKLELAERAQTWSIKDRNKLLLYRSFISLMEGDLSAALVSALECTRRDAEGHDWYVLGRAQYTAGMIHYLRNELEEAESHLRALVENRLHIEPDYLAHAACILMRMNFTRRELEEADDLFQLAMDYLQEMDNAWCMEVLRGFEVELALVKGDIEAARSLARNVNFYDNRPIWYHYLLQLTPVRLLLAQGTEVDIESARTLLDELEAHAHDVHRKTALVDILSWQALVSEAEGDMMRAFRKLSEALALGEPGAFISSFVDLGDPMADLLAQLREQRNGSEPAMSPYIDRILAAFPDHERDLPSAESPVASRQAASAMSELSEPLTERELQVLRLLATELTPTGIADQLVLSVHTVRAHTRNLYSKLDAHSRSEAVYNAKNLGLFESS